MGTMPRNLTVLALTLSIVACSSSDTTTATPAPQAPDAAAPPAWSTITSFDPAAYELPEGLVVHDGAAFVGLAPRGEIVRIDPSGTRSTYAHVPAGGNDGYTLGLVFDASGALFVLETKNDDQPTAPKPGVYKIAAAGDTATTPFASDPKMTFPNGAVFGPNGTLYVADSGAGAIFAIANDGGVTTWKEDATLSGSPACPAPLPFPIGANGIVFTKDAAFVANTAKGSIVKIDLATMAASAIVQDCAYVGIDGLALDSKGTIWATQNGAAGRVLQITQTGAVSVVKSDPLDGPASVAFATWNGEPSLLVTNSSFFSVGVDGGAPKPALVRLAPLP